MAAPVNPFGGGSKAQPTTKTPTAPAASGGGAVNPFAGKSGGGAKGGKKKSTFFGVNLPKLPFGGPDLPALGFHANVPSPVGTARDMVAGAVPGLFRLGGGLLKELAPDNPFKAKALPAKERGWHAVEKKMPITAMAGESMARTARQIPDTAAAVRPGGPGFGQSNLGHQIRDEGVLGTTIAKVADVATIAGGIGLVGKAAKLGHLAEAARLEKLAAATSQAAKLGKVADEFTLAKAATAADAAGDGARALDLAKAADQVVQANKLRAAVQAGSKGAQIGEKATAGAVKVSQLGNRAAATPFLPSQKALGLVGKGLGVAARSERLAPVVARAEQAVANLTQKRAVGDLHHETVTAPFQAEMHTLFQRHGLEDVARHLDGDEQAAVYLTKSAEAIADPAIRQLMDAINELPPEVRPDAVKRLFPDGDVTAAQLDLARRFEEGSLPPKQQAKMQTAAEAITGAQKRRQETVYETGRGTSKPLSEAALEARRQRAGGQSADMDVARITERKQAPIKARMENRADEAARIETDPREPAPLTLGQERKLAADAERTRRSEAQVKREEARTDRLAGTVLREQEKNATVAGNREGQVLGRAKARLEERDQLDTGVAARRKQAELKASRLEKAAAKAKREATKVTRTAAAEEARAEAAVLKGVPGQPKRGEVQSRISRDSRLANEKSKAEAAGAERHLSGEAQRQGDAVSQARTRLEKDQSAEAARRDRYETESHQKADRAAEKRLAELDRRNLRDLDALETAARDAADSVEAAPPQDRPALRVASRARDLALDLASAHPDRASEFLALADDIATTKSALDAKGIKTEYFFGGEELGKSSSPGATPRLSRAKKLQSERTRVAGKLARSVKGQSEKYAREALDILHNEFRPQVAKEFGSTVSESLGKVKHATGEELAARLSENDLVAWDPTTGKLLDAADITSSSAVLPKTLHDTVTKYTARRDPGVLLRVYDKATGKWKHTVLALSPRWHVGNIIGNAALATLGAGLTPAQIAKNLGEARRLVKDFEAGKEIPAEHVTALRRLLAAGYHNPDLGEVTGMTPGISRASKVTASGVNAIGEVISKSYTFNEYVDSLNRTMVYLAKHKGGVSSEAAVQMALKAAGDFSKMTPFERNVVRRIIPFYAWQRHITRLAFSLPIEHPGRVAWTLHLANLGDKVAPDPGADNPYNEGTIPLFGKRLNLRSADPFGSSFFVDPSLRGAGYSLNPVLKAGITAATGLSANTGFKPVATPESKFGQGPKGAFGAQHPVRLTQLLGQSIPQVRSLMDLDPLNLSDRKGQVPVRFETGQPRHVGKGATKPGAKPTLTGRGRKESLARLVGVPIPEPEQKGAPKKK